MVLDPVRSDHILSTYRSLYKDHIIFTHARVLVSIGSYRIYSENRSVTRIKSYPQMQDFLSPIDHIIRHQIPSQAGSMLTPVVKEQTHVGENQCIKFVSNVCRIRVLRARNANIRITALLVMLEPPKCSGILLTSIPIDPDHFQVITAHFREKFIFVHFRHFRNCDAFFGLYMSSTGSTNL